MFLYADDTVAVKEVSEWNEYSWTLRRNETVLTKSIKSNEFRKVLEQNKDPSRGRT